ncbi:major facilitator superfamily domain-containing protein 8-like [Watersipora subatra]|uniref:major facilitator superfamily domain-containing protein 8-like n=1 Tax=Watersipora subatra TaxID=2589382 RepID=UPI00355BF2E9
MNYRPVLNNVSVVKKRCTYVLICIISLFGGVEYAVILPTLYLHLQNTWHAAPYYLGLVLSAYSFAGLFSSPIMGRIYDSTRKSKLLISATNVFEFGGSLMYWFGISPIFLIVSRLIAGLGNGFFPVVLAEVSHDTSNTARTSVVSAIMATRQFGLLLGPAFNLFLSQLNFNIGPFVVNNYTSPGLFLACIWCLAQVFTMVLYTPLTKMVPVSQPPVGTVQAVPSAQDVTTLPNEYVTQNGNVPQTAHKHLPSDSPDSSINSDSSEPNLLVNGDVENSNIENDSQEAVTKHYTMKQVFLAITYDEYMAIYMLTFISLFNQCGVETLITPLCNDYMGWAELQLSLLYCVAGVLVIFGYFMVHVGSKRFKDRTLIIFGLLCQIASYSWNVYWLPKFRAHEPEDYVKNITLLIPSLIVNVFGLPFLFVCHISLFSKLLPMEVQGIGHGIRRIIGGLAAILGPLWAGGLLHNFSLMLGVMLGLNCLALLLLIISFRRLDVAIPTPSSSTATLTDEVQPPDKVEPEPANEQTPLLS